MSDPSDDDLKLAKTILGFWDAYLRAVQPMVLTYPGVITELPAHMHAPTQLVVTIAADGVVLAHVPDDQHTARFVYTPEPLDAVLEQATGGLFSPPFPRGSHVTLPTGARLQAVEEGTGRVLGDATIGRREVVGHRDPAWWDDRWAPVLAAAEFESFARAAMTGHLVPLVTAAEIALLAAADGLERLLEAEPPEEELQGSVKKSPIILSPTFSRFAAKPRLGSDYVPDFAFDDGHGRWTLVEIEASRHALFTRQGDPRSPLTHAVRQVTDWRDWVRANRAYARETLSGVTEVQGLVVIGRSTAGDASERLRRYEQSLTDIQVMTWDELVSAARRHAANIRRTTPVELESSDLSG